MICKHPVVMVGHAFPCGQCMPCRIKRGKVWRSRILLESRLHSENAFVTLTYSEKTIPNLWVESSTSLDGDMVLCGTLVPRHLQLVLKRMRRLYSPLTFRFFAVGEYGGRSWRPHYHAILFGFPGCKRLGGTLRSFDGSLTRAHDCCRWCSMLQKAWSKKVDGELVPIGMIHSGQVTAQSAGYISDYVLKKMVRSGDERLRGRNPEFARMSLRPGIARDCVPEMADVWMKLNREGDVPVGVDVGKKLHPIGRYLRNKWRVEVGLPEGSPGVELDEYQARLLALRESARNSEENPSFKKALIREFEGKVLEVEAWNDIFKRRKSL